MGLWEPISIFLGFLQEEELIWREHASYPLAVYIFMSQTRILMDAFLAFSVPSIQAAGLSFEHSTGQATLILQPACQSKARLYKACLIC